MGLQYRYLLYWTELVYFQNRIVSSNLGVEPPIWKVIKEKVEDIYMRSYNDENIVENGEPCKPSNNIINEQAMLKNHPELNDVRICQNGVPLYDDKFKHINELLQVGGLQQWCQVDIYL